MERPFLLTYSVVPEGAGTDQEARSVREDFASFAKQVGWVTPPYIDSTVIGKADTKQAKEEDKIIQEVKNLITYHFQIILDKCVPKRKDTSMRVFCILMTGGVSIPFHISCKR